MPTMHKYPRTHHLEGSRLQPGDEDLSNVPLSTLFDRHIVVEEKVDGGNAGISFDEDGKLYLQSRGHFLDGGSRERHFALFKTWANRWRSDLFDVLGARYVLYGEWLYAKHTVFYDALPHYFLEFDVLDTANGTFLSTPVRRALLDSLPIVSVPVLWEGRADRTLDLGSHIAPSLFKSDRWTERLVEVCRQTGLREDRVVAETDRSDLAEGLYVKAEENGRVVERYKLIRPSFLQAVLESESHWLDRPILPNQLAPDVDLFGSEGGA